ncbi:beta-1,4-mannosyltransferase egh [Aplysia californica]|uniref:Beta-1,4-mannosyltransferase egh n=1 Tax=Aplysia californica TaxID=6500 RepID=A0ABM0JJS8_APLCA|nr:beta-1,4-mannosyltransferase egh [Aplysia californica]XP_005095317.1 beta-1,4-mannosyltransferase egh [Aplysia californica]XP_005095319.1 beta-1,4-mannosyltransferase egh [Aplysia californica]XP_005095320.1 beta-1,4-mannosyltransferase egh [Aplysia californica]XP_035824839.1 beta-1,4-mannosyltransferase egh [Aplysia californica]
MTKFGELLGRNPDSSPSEERPIRQVLLIAIFFLLWHSERIHRQWRRFLDNCGLRLNNYLRRDPIGILWRSLSQAAVSVTTSLMQLISKRPVLVCWPRQLQNFFLLHWLVFAFSRTRHLLVGCISRVQGANWQYCLVQLAMTIVSAPAVRRLKHAMSVIALFGLIRLVGIIRGGVTGNDFNAIERYGLLVTLFIYFLQCLVFVPLPFFIFNFLGVVLLNVFTTKPKLKSCPSLSPFLCFRVVTRGLYPDLVNENVRHNIKICNNIGLQKYVFEVVTDIPINLEKQAQSREVVVPTEYKTSSGSLFKARALQYALEPEVDNLQAGDWIVHLDEETLLTEESVIGIINFAGAADYSFGQGVITYGHGQVVNWITTLADSVRVGIDYGCLRFSLGVLHKPIFSWKGSFIVADAEAEKDISFDHGPEASIAEDCFFACKAFSKGYSFGIVEGEMLEKSTFTLYDFIHQRHRWMHGILLTALSKKIPLRYKVGPVLMSLAGCTMPFNMLLFPISMIWPMPPSPVMYHIYTFVVGIIIYLFVLGTLQTFSIKQHGLIKCCLLVIATVLCGIIASVLENISSLRVYWIPKSSTNGFYVVNKQVQSECMKIL